MMLLTEKELPKTVWLGNIEYPINTDFRDSIKFELLMEADEVPEDEKWIEALKIYFGDVPWDVQTATEAIISFYCCGKTEEEIREQNRKMGASTQKQVYSFKHDSDLIYAAFLDQYGIDLNKTKYLHWWAFRSMFNGLRDDMRITKIIGYRSADEEKWMSEEQKKEIRRLHKIWDLPRNKHLTEREDTIADILMNGGDIDAYLGIKRSGKN
ncbi:bacteriophage Gp15 family protein [Eubacterium limosum]|uniref:bacteriophage Gp15 family protein n=1 Tax=Eubacterium limosum TaxID=1736 RepID=UPI001063301C|nr:bacteriophage Gp15 family protein [Eubacterium limosum]